MIGQESAKKVLSVAVYNHYKRLAVNVSNDPMQAQQNNIVKPVIMTSAPSNPPRGTCTVHVKG